MQKEHLLLGVDDGLGAFRGTGFKRGLQRRTEAADFLRYFMLLLWDFLRVSSVSHGHRSLLSHGQSIRSTLLAW